MKRIDWEDTWINTLIDAGFSLSTARATYRAMYAEDGPNFTKDPVEEAMEMLGEISKPEIYQNFSAEMNAARSDQSVQRLLKRVSHKA